VTTPPLPDEGGTALDQADRLADVHGEEFTESLRLLLRAKVVQARGEPADVVRAAAAQAKAISTERGTYVIARRAEELTAAISSSAGDLRRYPRLRTIVVSRLLHPVRI
jgi:hypothetical protein